MLKYTNNNKKGFTLIELLVTVALLVSVLAIVIISITNVSKKQKENAYERVKEQAMTAAEQYFSTNEYLFEGMSDGTTASITVGKLVEEGFLNVLTDPTTGKKLNECSFVELKKQNGKYSIKFNEEVAFCGTNNQLTVTEPDAIGGEVVFFNSQWVPKKDSNGDGWLNKNELGEENNVLYLCIKPGRVGATSVTIDSETATKNDDNYCIKKTSEFKKNISDPFSWQIDFNGKKTKGDFIIGKDTIAPTINDLTTMASNKVKFNINFNDNNSGFSKATLNNPSKTILNSRYEEEYSLASNLDYNVSAYDKAGNSSEKNNSFAYTPSDNEAPLVTVNIYKSDDSGKKTGNPIHTGQYRGKDADKNSISINGGNWMNSKDFPHGVYIEYYANESSSAVWYWNKGGLTKTQAKAEENTWDNDTNCYGSFCNNSGEEDLSVVGTKVGHWYKGEGARRGRIYVKDASENGNDTRIYISAYFDRTAPKVSLNRKNGSIRLSGSANAEDKSGTIYTQIVSYAFSTDDKAPNAKEWKNVTKDDSISKDKDVNATDAKSQKYYFYAKDAAGNVGRSAGIDRYKLCETIVKKSPANSSDTSIGKIYNWKYVGNNGCSATNPKRYYQIKEYQCICNVDKVYNKYNCGYSSYNDVTKTTHPNSYNGIPNIATIYYMKNNNGASACRGDKKYNEYVDYVCDSPSSSYNGYRWHGYSWFEEKTDFANFNPASEGTWYHNGGNDDKYLYNTSEKDAVKKACNAACNGKYGKVEK